MVALGIAGIVGPLWFTTLVIVQSLRHPDYNQMALPISALAAWPGGWLQSVNFYGFAVLMIAYAVGLHRAVQPTRRSWVSLALLLVSGVGLFAAGVFPWRRVGDEFVVPVGHLVAAFMSFGGAALGLIAMSRRMAADPRWRGLASYTLGSGVLMLVMFVAMGRLAVPSDAPLHAWAGFGQRVIVAVWFACTLVLATRSVTIARATAERSTTLND